MLHERTLSPLLGRSGLWLVLAMLLAAGFALSAADTAHGIERLRQCADNIDNDGDGKIDFPADAGCSTTATGAITDDSESTVPAVTQCNDLVDGDGDGKAAYPDDPGCATPADTSESNAAPTAASFLCANAVSTNNAADGDTLADYPKDPGCVAASDPSEDNVPCADGEDNDLDAKIDFPIDWGCPPPRAVGTVPTTPPNMSIDAAEPDPPQCDDGRDNDGDGKIDFDGNPKGANDPDCTGPTDNKELAEPACSNGTDDDDDGKVDFPADPGCESAADVDETDPPPPPAACSDTIDNDLDGRIDFPDDPGCSSPTDENETDATPPPPPPPPPPPAIDHSYDPTPPFFDPFVPATVAKVYPPISPFPVVRLRGSADDTGVLITLLRVQAPPGSRVVVYCKGPGCPQNRLSTPALLLGPVRARVFERRLRAGTSLTIYVTKAGFTGKYTRFVIQKRKPPTRTDRCARSVGAPPVACPVN